MAAVANARPSKEFFVGMLTRDIDLQDAILDLIDNCIDGVHRQIAKRPPKDRERPFKGYHASLNISKSTFSISDNCGGIPRTVAEKYAFRLGRPADMKAEKLPTVGLYGIGMKRALFKIGRESSVTTNHEGSIFRVAVSSDWLDDDDDWQLPITNLSQKTAPESVRGTHGTYIQVNQLYSGISHDFDNQKSQFLLRLASTISTHYSFIIQKGFQIQLNGEVIKPAVLGLLQSDPKMPKDQRIDPFIYTTNRNGVDVDLVIGLYRRLPTPEEVEQELEGQGATGNKEQCGWSVICNDRVVVYSDKTRLTGWGEAGVPAYHPQFIAIAGMVRFHSTDAGKLPVTTTKRGIDASSDLYLTVKDIMREGLKHFTNFTNHWKLDTKQRDALIQSASAVKPFSAKLAVKQGEWSDVRKGLGGKKFVPNLPRPPKTRDDKVSIKFRKPPNEILLVSEFLFDRDDMSPDSVGEACFDRILARASK
ncbi:ATP-binding protein [Lysobacter sp. Root690]|uniref:ATP-binding protein n=1 Tax=Lysobacter sp. Root690 TaxID=1736588 RepID=UPI0009EA4885|nr:ATP-binding protein [Lysobacter sp. Root690]